MEGEEVGQFLDQIGGIRWLLRKNRIENGSRAEPRGSNPHSYGDNFSVSGAIWASQKFKVVSTVLRIKERDNINVRVFIALLWVVTRF